MLKFLKSIFGRSSSNAKQLLAEGAIIVDVRTPYEFKGGHVKGSKNIPLDTLPKKISDLKKLDKTIITVCRSGARSSAAKDMLTAQGISACNGGTWTNFK